MSVRIATIVPEDKLNSISLVNIARKALRQAKKRGRNAVVSWCAANFYNAEASKYCSALTQCV